ncbi:XdhC/CoxI family protein [Virgibacillus sp. 179-BFC.A HS]|uniref:XdhC/CoxI family protein n=1 Tax=Tigheibacillus jepli TaxID=3035914 RepID=A0ABU5CIL2_9BACI|nr:XdhC/CoxI family protein [Virgibacillus sp. 179-BFC.A HS]MDY0405659.1 XdhC/CoxI family protein [Virgibacillus sp. 179-BFC.A HS]
MSCLKFETSQLPQVEGSAYRKEGTTMLLFADGRRIGMLSAGCLEEELQHQARQMLFHQEEMKRFVYDMSVEDDLGWGRGAGCNGKIHVLLEIVTNDMRNQLMRVHQYIEKGIKVKMIKSVSSQNKHRFRFYTTSSGQFFGDDFQFIPAMNQWLNQDKKTGCYLIDNDEEIYVHTIDPMPRLFIFGAGEDVKPLVSIALQTGFRVHIWDWRPALLNEPIFRRAQLIDTNPAAIIDKMTWRKSDAVVIMTHDFQKDREILQQFLASNPPCYIGIMGPRDRTRRLFAGKPVWNRLNAPIGLPIGAQGPEEIAVSIMAEIIQYVRGSLAKHTEDSHGKKEDYRDISGGWQ